MYRSNVAVRDGGHNRGPRVAQLTNLKPVRKPVTLYSGEEGESFIPEAPSNKLSYCMTDGNSYRADGPFKIYFGPTADGVCGRVLCHKDICDNHDSLVACKRGKKCYRAHAAMGTVMTGLKGINPRIIGPLDPKIMARHANLFVYNDQELARRAAIGSERLGDQRAHLKRLREEREAHEGELDEEKELAAEIAEEEARKTKRAMAVGEKATRRYPAAPRPTVDPSLAAVACSRGVEEGTGLSGDLTQAGTSMASIDVHATDEEVTDPCITGTDIHSDAKEAKEDALAPPGDNDGIVRAADDGDCDEAA